MKNGGLKLGVNIDHVATIRQARRATYPDIAQAAAAAIAGGADFITVHLREDRRHIIDSDLPLLRAAAIALKTHVNLETALTDEMRAIALREKPRSVCLVPEKREELTTEGGLNVAAQTARARDFTAALTAAGIEVSFFIDPCKAQIDAAASAGAAAVELHTGAYAAAASAAAAAVADSAGLSEAGGLSELSELRELRELSELSDAAAHAAACGLKVNAGHGLTLSSVRPLCALPLAELNIGHSIVARALFIGLTAAVAEMRAAITAAVALT